jgi:hypothetical protein
MFSKHRFMLPAFDEESARASLSFLKARATRSLARLKGDQIGPDQDQQLPDLSDEQFTLMGIVLGASVLFVTIMWLVG